MPEATANTHTDSIIHAVLRLVRVFEKSFMFMYYEQFMLAGRRDEVLIFVKRRLHVGVARFNTGVVFLVGHFDFPGFS